MVEMELYLNTNRVQIRQAVLFVGSSYQNWRLKELLDHTDLDKLILTGYLTPEQAEEILEPLQQQAAFGRQRLPAEMAFCPLDQLTRPEGTYALLCEALDENRDILPLVRLAPDYLVGQVEACGISSFAIWEAFRATCKHIRLVTKRSDAAPQVLDWEKNPDSDIELSVILPMYNVAKYLDRCIESVTAWEADYVEFLFVNDGSPDNSRDIVLRWAQKDKRIKLLDKTNGGCASARQWGLDRSQGRYVGFVDPDDFIDESMYRKLLRAAMTGSYEIAYCGYREYYENTGEIRDAQDILGSPFDRGVTDVRRIQELAAFCAVAIWRGIYKKEMLLRNGIHFYTELRRFDDLPFKVETFAAARSVIAVNEHLYYYRLARPGQDVSADDERLYVHFPIFAHLNESIAAKKDPRLTDCLQICKIQTHRYALEKIRPEFLKEYARQAREDLVTTGRFLRTYFLFKEMVGKKSAMIYWGIMTRNYRMLRRLCK